MPSPILQASAQLAFLLACRRERLIFSVSARDVRLGNGGPPGDSRGPSGRRATRHVFSGKRNRWLVAARLAFSPVADLANTLFPSDCRLCGSPLLLLSRAPVCETCRSRVTPLPTESLCSRCGDVLGSESARFAAALGVTDCTTCRLAPPEFVRALAFTAYDHTARELLHLLKFQGVSAVASSLMGESMARVMRAAAGDVSSSALVIPVPLFMARERSRGFNQAQLLAEAGVARLRKLDPEWPLELRSDLLRRVRDTRSSFAMAPHTRRENLRGAFRVVHAEALRGRDVLLVDDILTTGATARECARVLLRAGAASVRVATYARTLSEEIGEAGVARWTGAASPLT